MADKLALLLELNYADVEARLLAHAASKDQPKDIHRETAADVFQCKESEVTPAMRRAGKAMNYLAMYSSPMGGLRRGKK